MFLLQREKQFWRRPASQVKHDWSKFLSHPCLFIPAWLSEEDNETGENSATGETHDPKASWKGFYLIVARAARQPVWLPRHEGWALRIQ